MCIVLRTDYRGVTLLRSYGGSVGLYVNRDWKIRNLASWARTDINCFRYVHDPVIGAMISTTITIDQQQRQPNIEATDRQNNNTTKCLLKLCYCKGHQDHLAGYNNKRMPSITHSGRSSISSLSKMWHISLHKTLRLALLETKLEFLLKLKLDELAIVERHRSVLRVRLGYLRRWLRQSLPCLRASSKKVVAASLVMLP